MNDWDSVSSPAEDTEAAWEAVSTPRPEGRKTRQSIKISIPRRFVLLALAGLVVLALAGGAFAIYRASTATVLQQDTSGDPAINDPLSNNRNNWAIVNTSLGGTCAFTGAAYHISSPNSSYVIECTSAIAKSLNNFAFQVQINIIKGDYAGIFFGNSANASYILFISSQGTYALTQHLTNGNQNQDLRLGSSPAIKKGLNQANVLTVIVKNSNFYLYVNDQPVTSDNLIFYSQGSAGFGVWNGEQLTTEAVFSNLKIWTL